VAIVVVGGSGRGVGKTALVCGLIRALPEIPWTAVKITSDAHAVAKPIFEETDEARRRTHRVILLQAHGAHCW